MQVDAILLRNSLFSVSHVLSLPVIIIPSFTNHLTALGAASESNLQLNKYVVVFIHSFAPEFLYPPGSLYNFVSRTFTPSIHPTHIKRWYKPPPSRRRHQSIKTSWYNSFLPPPPPNLFTFTLTRIPTVSLLCCCSATVKRINRKNLCSRIP